jgi:hypothetical protein
MAGILNPSIPARNDKREYWPAYRDQKFFA